MGKSQGTGGKSRQSICGACGQSGRSRSSPRTNPVTTSTVRIKKNIMVALAT